MASRAMELKEEGNHHFMAGDYTGAEGLYSKAIIADGRNPVLYTNRAMARLKLAMWDSVTEDCLACLRLSQTNMKAYYYLSQAQLALADYDAAVESATKAHELCATDASADKSLTMVTAQVLRCKKERWDDRDKRRAREAAALEAETVARMEHDKAQAAADGADEHDQAEIQREWDDRIAAMKRIFEAARANGEKRREVPDWAIDDISFGIMVDPVVTKSGKSYERASIMEHLRHSETDPVTREPLSVDQLRPNLALKQACDEFLSNNGWAVDW